MERLTPQEYIELDRLFWKFMKTFNGEHVFETTYTMAQMKKMIAKRQFDELEIDQTGGN